MIRNVILDWSGTLVDDLPAVWRASNQVFVRAGVTELSLEEFRNEFSLPFKNFYERYTPAIPLPQLEEWYHGHFNEFQSSVCELPHARQFLEFCRARGIRMFLLSTIHRQHFQAQVASNGFDQFLEKAYVEVWDKRKKIGEVLEENGLAPEETVFVGDMQHDVETARVGGVHSCAVLTGYNRLEQLRAAEPDLIVEHLGELQDIFERNQFKLPHAGSGQEESPISHPISTVGALIFNDQREVLMIRTHKWSDRWGIPGGKIKFGETAVEALRRELKEETNLDVDGIRFVLVQDCIHSPEFYRDAHFILLNYVCRGGQGRPVVLNAEAQEFRWLSLSDALALPLNAPTRTLIERVISEDGHDCH